MPGAIHLPYSTAEQVTLGLSLVLVVLVALIGYRAWQRSRVSPEERERQRRVALVARGKMGDATLAEVHEDLLFYSYDVRGVEYTACQDVSHLKQYMPNDLSALGPICVRYDPRNPANSIVLAEQWSGLRVTKASES